MYKLIETLKSREKRKEKTLNYLLGALYRISLIGFKEDIPYNLINAVSSINKLYANQVIYPNFKCYDCDGTLVSETKNEYVLN